MSLEQIDQQLHQQVKIIVVGDSGAGKTSIIKRYYNKLQRISPTIGVEFQSTNIMLKNRNIQINIWDTSGQEKYNSMTSQHYKKTNGAIIIYDITKRKSFLNCSKWLSQVIEKAPDDIDILLLGNKIDRCQFRTSQVDLIQQFEDNVRQVQKQQVSKFATQNNLTFGQVSAITGYNIEPLFQQFIQKVTSKMITQNEYSTGNLLDNAPIKQQNSCCKC